MIPKIVGTDDLFAMVENVLMQGGLAEMEILIVVTAGVPTLRRGTTNMVKVHRVGAVTDRTRVPGTQTILSYVRSTRRTHPFNEAVLGELKAKAGDALMLFRMGDFYELFSDDAVEAARILEITLTSRDRNKPNPMPMAGVPHHSVQGYIQRLLKAGKKVAIAEQMEDPALVKGPKAIVRRDIVRVFTPAVQFDHEGNRCCVFGDCGCCR